MNNSLLPIILTVSLSASALAGSPTLRGPMIESDLHKERWVDGDYFFGDWGGARTRLAEAGITFDSYYVSNPAGLASGGLSGGKGFSYVDNFYLGITFDLEQLIGWRGAQLAVSGINRDGGSLTEAYVGSRYDVQQVHGGQNIFFYNLTLEQRFWDDKMKLKIGRFAASDDFNTSPVYGLFMNNGIDGNIRNVVFDTQFSAYPFATWAARFRFDPTPEFNFQVGVYQTWTEIFDRGHNGLDWRITDDDGVMMMAQIGWTPEFFKRPVPAESDGKSDPKTVAVPQMKGLRGHYWIGGSYSPWNKFPQFGKTETTGGSYGFYAHADQMVWQEAPGSDEGLTLFTAVGYYPQDNISIMPFQVNFGGYYTGLIPGREKDKTIAGLIYGRFGDDYARTVTATGLNRPTRETVFEFGYRVQLTKFAYLQPDLQYVMRPSGTGEIDNALILGAQIGITF